MTPVPAGCYLWEVPEKPVRIALDLRLLERLSAEIMPAFFAVPRRGAEVGGLLLGRVQPGHPALVVVEDLESVPCEHRQGPSYSLSDADRQAFAAAVERHGPAVVGYYRSHTREGLSLSAEDLALITRHCASPHQVALLVKPYASRPGTAGFFIWEDGQMHGQASYQEFPLQKPEAAAPLPPIVPPPPRGLAFRDSLLVGVLVFLATLFGTAGAVRGIHEAFAAAPEPSAGLRVRLSGKLLRVEWDRQASLITEAERAVLTIHDGEHQQFLRLSSAQLRTGSVVYNPATTEVAFELNILGPRQNSTETLRYVSAR